MKSFVYSLIVLACASVASAGQNVVIVFDDSGSMGATLKNDSSLNRMEAAKRALTGAVSQLPSDTNLGLVCLNGDWRPENWRIPLGPLNREAAVQQISQLAPTGGTPLGGCMKAGTDALLALRAKQHYGVYTLLVVTDGEAQDGELVERYLPDIISRGVNVDAIGVDMNGEHSLATKVHSYRRGDDPKQLQQAIVATFAETSGSKDGAEDFSILAAIPDGAAEQYLKALGEVDNSAIGSPKGLQPKVDGPGGVIQVDQNGNPVTESSSIGVGGFLGILFGLVIFVLIVALVLSNL